MHFQTLLSPLLKVPRMVLLSSLLWRELGTSLPGHGPGEKLQNGCPHNENKANVIDHVIHHHEKSMVMIRAEYCMPKLYCNILRYSNSVLRYVMNTYRVRNNVIENGFLGILTPIQKLKTTIQFNKSSFRHPVAKDPSFLHADSKD